MGGRPIFGLRRWCARRGEVVGVRAGPLTFRGAGAADVESVVQLVESAYRGATSRAGWTTEADLLDGQRTDRQEVSDLIAAPGVSLVLALSAGQVVGCVSVKREAVQAVQIGMFAIRPALQAQGLGRALLGEAERVAEREHSATRASMTVIEQRPELIAWYGRRGYKPTGETQAFPYGSPRFGLPRRPDLRFVVLEKGLGTARA
jgi:GNAT superfamily N-acetyltransferase